MNRLIFHFLENLYLQTGNPVVDWFNNLFGIKPSQVGGTLVVTPDWIPLVTITILAFFFFIVIRYFINSRRKPNDEEPLGIMEFVVVGQGRFDGFVNKYENAVKPSYIRALKGSSKFSDKGIDMLIDLREKGNLYFYQMYYRDTRDLIVSTLKRRTIPVLLVSTAPLDEKKYASVQSEASWSWVTLGYDYIKTCICNSATEKIEVELQSGELMDVWILAPIPDPKVGLQLIRSGVKRTETEKIRFLDRIDMDIKEIKMEVTVLPYSEEIATIASNMVIASKQIEYIYRLKEQMTNQERELSLAHAKVNKLQRMVDTLKLLVSQKSLVNLGIPVVLAKAQDFLIWIFISGIATIFGTQLPNYFPALSSMNPLVGGMIGLIVVFAGYMFFARPKNNETPEELPPQGVMPS